MSAKDNDSVKNPKETVRIPLTRETREKLKRAGWKGETYDDILLRLMNQGSQNNE